VKKIAIYHNLYPGGALHQMYEISKKLLNLNYQIDYYSLSPTSSIKTTQQFIHYVPDPKNLFQELYQVIYVLPKLQKRMAREIDHKKYDAVLVFPCKRTQAPHLLKYLKNKSTFYMFMEPKREFYEPTSFSHNCINKWISRKIRSIIKIIDKRNCQKAHHIISNSYFTQNNLRKIYKRNSIVLIPAIKQIKKIYQIKINNQKVLSLGLLSMLKGHHISSNVYPKLHIYGKTSHDNIKKFISTQTKIFPNFTESVNTIYKKYDIFMANQINEPFGLTTLEATNKKLFIIGTNEGGTCEIVQNGINGILLPISNISLSRKIINSIINSRKIKFFKNCIIDWNHTTKNLIKILNV
jgi:glycosyltransferase involved in cell wall biosynthesis